jgi:hypothetical protein
MQFDIVTIFPAMVEQALGVGVVGRALSSEGRSTSPSTTCARSPSTAIASWTMSRTAAAREWC